MSNFSDSIIPFSSLDKKLLLKLGFSTIPYKKSFLELEMEKSITPLTIRPCIEPTSLCESSALQGLQVKERSTPITNRGVSELGEPNSTDFNWINSYDSLETKELKINGKGKAIFVTTPLPDQSINNQYSFIDYLNFSFKVSDLDYFGVSDDDIMVSLSPVLSNIFGFGITGQRPNGLNFYKFSYDLGINGWGTVCIGGQRDTILVTLKGQGLMASKRDWPKALHTFLSGVESAKITRVDIAHDSFNSKNSVDSYLEMFRAGLFTNRGQTPNVECHGNWENINGKGRTLYIGTRVTGKLLRIYEKGLQLGRGFSEIFPNWVRTELELRADQRIIPLDVLKNPSQYLAGAYPALKPFSVIQKVAETCKNSAKATIASAIEITKNQFGKYIWTFVQLYGAEKAIALLTVGKEQLPANLDIQDHNSFDPVFNISPARTISFDEVLLL